MRVTISEKNWNDLGDYRDALEHYGVKGMRWGVRKERESAGSSRRGSSSSKRKKRKTFSEKVKARREARAKTRVARAKKRAEAEAAKKVKEQAKKEKKRKDILNDPTKLYKHRREYSAQEIQDAMKQFDWERKLSDYSKTQLSNGADYINTITKYVNNSINLYNAAARIVNTVSDKSIPYVEPAIKEKKKSQNNS